MQSIPNPLITASAVVLTATLAALPARAQSSDPPVSPAAQALYNQAVAALDEKDYASACPKLEEVVRLMPAGVGAKLTLAKCYEGAGRLASAWTTYSLAEAAAIQAGQGERQKIAHDRAETLRQRCAELTIVVPEAIRALPGLEIRRDGAAVGPVQWDLPLPIDQGRHAIAVIAAGRARWEKAIEIPADGARVSVTIEQIADVETSDPEEVTQRPAQAPWHAPPVTAPAPNTAAKRPSWQRTAGLVVGGIGISSLGAGTLAGVLAAVKRDESNADGHCHDGNRCDTLGIELRDEGRTAATAATALFIVGGVAIAGGVTLFVTAPSAPSAASASLAVGPNGMMLRGAW